MGFRKEKEAGGCGVCQKNCAASQIFPGTVPEMARSFGRKHKCFLAGGEENFAPKRKENRKKILRFRKVLRRDFAKPQRALLHPCGGNVIEKEERRWVLRLFAGCDILKEKVG